MASKTSRTFVWIILGLVMFGLVGFGATNFGGSARSIGTVGDTEIDANRYFQELNQTLNAFRAQTGQQLPMAQAEAFGLTNQALGRVVSAATLDNEADRLGLSIGDETLRAQLMRMPEFQGTGGVFTSDTYEFVLQQSRLVPSEFEANLRADLTRGILQTAITSGAGSSPTYADTLFSFARETRDFTWAKLDLAALETQPGTPTDEALTTYYEAHPADYTLPQIKHVTVAWLRPDTLLDDVEVDEAELLQLYESRAEQFNQPERRLVERLVFADEAEAQAAADALTAGDSNFATLVADRGLALSDVDLGDVSKSALGEAGDAVFAMLAPGIVGPVPSNLGPALYRMNAILSAQHTPFEDAADELRAEYAGDAARRIVLEMVGELDDQLAGGATLEEMVDTTEGMELSTLDWHPDTTGGIAAYEGFRATIGETFEGDYPEIITLADGGVFALRVDSVDAPRLRDLSEVTDDVTVGWTAQQSLVLLEEQARAMLPTLQSGGDSLSSLGLTEIAETAQTRDVEIDGTPFDLVTDLFALAEGDWLVMQDVDGVVLAHLERISPADHDSDEAVAAKAAFNAQLAQELGLDYEAAFSNALQNQAGITLNQPVINAIHRQFP